MDKRIGSVTSGAKILSAILAVPESINDISRKTGINWETVRNHCEAFEKEGIVFKRTWGNRTVYLASFRHISELPLIEAKEIVIKTKMLGLAKLNAKNFWVISKEDLDKICKRRK